MKSCFMMSKLVVYILTRRHEAVSVFISSDNDDADHRGTYMPVRIVLHPFPAT